MQNTWSIDRTWKPRKGRSRPALMVEDNTTPTPLRGGGIDTTANETCGNEHERPQAIDNETRVHRPVPEPSPRPAPPRKRRAGTTEFAAVMAWGRRPVPFRTRKLRPSTAMVLHSEGCGRVAHRRSTTHKGPRTAHAATGPLPHTPTRTHTRKRTRHHHKPSTATYAVGSLRLCNSNCVRLHRPPLSPARCLPAP